MRVPLSWLNEYVSLPASVGVLIERLTLAGLESAGVQLVGVPVPEGVSVKPADAGLVWDRATVVVAKVLSIEKHPEADKLKMVTVDYGAAEPKTVITGAPNIAPGQSGMKVVLGLRGSRYYSTDKDGKKFVATLEPKVLRGIPNDAMCMSNFELGIADDHDGIIILDDADAAPGAPIQELLGEQILELDVLPNMARCLAMLGVAREVAALTGQTVSEPDLSYPTSEAAAAGRVIVEIQNPKLCPRYAAVLLQNVLIAPAPRWMRSRLQSAGLRPISNVVDVTNYVMLEYGQPLHAFDFDVLVQRAGGSVPTIIVRSAKAGETLKTLDNQVRELTTDDLVIADTAGPIALAGVMGGLETEVTANTTNILLEAASFDFVSVRKTARKFNLFSEASTRYSRGVSPAVVPRAAARAAQLLAKHAGAEVLAGMVEAYPLPFTPTPIELNKSEIFRVLGFELPAEEVERVLNALDFQVEPTMWGWTVTPPDTRLDLQAGAADLIEELARVSGYDKLPESLLAQEMPTPTGNPTLEFEQTVRELLGTLGLSEAICYSLSSIGAEAAFVPSGAEYVSLKNPISPERSVMRRTLLAGLVEVGIRNLAERDALAMYELGPVFEPVSGAALPNEPRRLAMLVCGRRTPIAFDEPQGTTPARFDFYDLKGIVDSLAAALHLPQIEVRPAPNVSYLHPGRAAELVAGGVVIGQFGELHPRTAVSLKLAERSVQLAEFDLDALQAAVPARYAYKPFSTFPPAKRDVAMILPQATPADAVRAELLASGAPLLADAVLFDVYTGDRVPAGTKSLAYALTYQAADRTLGDKEIEKTHERIEAHMRTKLNAQIRGKDGV